MTITKAHAEKDRSSHVYVFGVGYAHVGRPELPAQPQAPAKKCEPPAAAADASWHKLQPPKGAQLMTMRWHRANKEWTPVVMGSGNRMGFTSEYLAAHGWTYKRACTNEEKPKG